MNPFEHQLAMLRNTRDDGARDTITCRIDTIIQDGEPTDIREWFGRAVNERYFTSPDSDDYLSLSLIIDRLLDHHLWQKTVAP